MRDSFSVRRWTPINAEGFGLTPETAEREGKQTPPEKEALERQIAATDRRIDELVYEVYGLTEEEVRIVEGE